MLDLAHVRSFAAAADELHFGRAARRLNMTQSPLSRHVQLLEQELGTPLFVRAKRSVSLTRAGRTFLTEAKALLDHADAAARAARRAGGEHAGTVQLGFVAACCYGFLPRLVAQARRDLPEVTLSLHELTSDQQIEGLARGRLDLGLVRPVPARPGIQATCVFRENLAAAFPVEHRLARKRRIRLRDVNGEPFVMYSIGGPYMHGMLTAAFAEAGVVPQVEQELSNAQAILSLVSAGIGMAIVPVEARRACFDNVVFRPVELGAGQVAELHAIWSPGADNQIVSPLRDLALQVGSA